jgi:hypothetical protein
VVEGLRAGGGERVMRRGTPRAIRLRALLADDLVRDDAG